MCTFHLTRLRCDYLQSLSNSFSLRFDSLFFCHSIHNGSQMVRSLFSRIVLRTSVRFLLSSLRKLLYLFRPCTPTVHARNFAGGFAGLHVQPLQHNSFKPSATICWLFSFSLFIQDVLHSVITLLSSLEIQLVAFSKVELCMIQVL